MTIQGGSLPRHMIYALSLANGRTVAHWPINVDNQMAARKANFSSELQGQRSSLQFFKGKLYVTYAGRAGDCGKSRKLGLRETPHQRGEPLRTNSKRASLHRVAKPCAKTCL